MISDDLTIAMLSKSLDAKALQQTLISSNIANANTDGYKPLRVDFDTKMAELDTLVDSNAADSEIRAKLSTLSPAVVIDAEDDKVRIDKEMALMSQNSVEYKALLKGVKEKYAIMSLAINGGNK